MTNEEKKKTGKQKAKEEMERLDNLKVTPHPQPPPREKPLNKEKYSSNTN